MDQRYRGDLMLQSHIGISTYIRRFDTSMGELVGDHVDRPLTVGGGVSVQVNANLGASGTAVLVPGSVDLAGSVTLTPGGAGIASGVLATVTFTNPFVVNPQNATGIPRNVSATRVDGIDTDTRLMHAANVTATKFDIVSFGAPTSGRAYVVGWSVTP